MPNETARRAFRRGNRGVVVPQQVAEHLFQRHVACADDVVPRPLSNCCLHLVETVAGLGLVRVCGEAQAHPARGRQVGQVHVRAQHVGQVAESLLEHRLRDARRHERPVVHLPHARLDFK